MMSIDAFNGSVDNNGNKIFCVWSDTHQTKMDTLWVDFANKLFCMIPDLATDVLPVQGMVDLVKETLQEDEKLKKEFGARLTPGVLPEVEKQAICSLLHLFEGENTHITQREDGFISTSSQAYSELLKAYQAWVDTGSASVSAYGRERLERIAELDCIYQGMSHSGLGATTYDVNYGAPKPKR